VKPSASTGVPVPQKSDHEAPGDGTRGIPTAGHPIEEALASLERGLRRFDARRTSLLVLAVAMALSVVALLYFGRGQSFTSDEWLYLTDWPGWSLGSLFHPDNGHLFFTANVVLNASVSIFGTSYEPLRIVTVVLVQVNGGLFYVLARRRVGPVLALLPTILLLFLGSSFGIVLMAFSINSLLSVGFGLCALLALDREDFRGDVTAAAMLALSVLSFEWGLFFAVGMAIEMWVRRNRPPLSRFLLPAIPLVIWGVWKLWAPAEPGDDISVANIGSLFTSAATVAATLLASITGLFRTPGSYSSTINAEWGVPLVVVGVIALGARLRLRGWPSARFFFLAATLILLWLAVGLTINAYRGPTTDRYVYGGAIILFLLLAELLRGVRVPIGAYAGIVIVLAFSLIANVVQLKEAGAEVRGYSEAVDARIGALEIVRGSASRSFRLDQPQPGAPLAAGLTFTAGSYYDAVDEHGSFGTSEAGLLQNNGAGYQADLVIANALGVTAVPVKMPPAPGSVPIEALGAAAGSIVAEGPCQRVKPDTGRTDSVTVSLPPGGFSLRTTPYAETSIGLGRFSTEYPVKLEALRGSGVVKIDSDRSDQPWRAQLGSERPFTVCPMQPGDG
jgi:hypothetical protein